MKLIDSTPLQDEKGEIGIVQRIQGTLKYGTNWYPELEAQKFAIASLQRGLAKGYVVVRNHTLGASGIIVPLAMVGPAGIFAIYVTHLRGHYQAKGDSWGTISGTSFKPASINLLTRTERLARALQAFIERQGVNLPKPVEPILLTTDPGMHVESVRPLVRVVMADAIERWAASLGKGAPVLTVVSASELADRIVNPRAPKKEKEPEEVPAVKLPDPYVQVDEYETSLYDEAQTFDPNDLGFAYEDSGDEELHHDPPEFIPEVSVSAPAQRSVKKRYLGMSIPQLALLGGMLLVELCVLIGFAIVISLNP